MNVVPTDVLPNYVKQHFVNSRADQVQRTVRAQIHQKTVHDLTGPKLLEIMNQENREAQAQVNHSKLQDQKVKQMKDEDRQ